MQKFSTNYLNSDLKMCRETLGKFTYLHEEAPHQSFANVDVIITTCKICARPSKIKPVHNPGQLRSDIICTLEGSVVDEVVVTPLGILMVWKQNHCHT